MKSRNETGFYSAVARIDAGMELKDIADELDISINTIRRWRTEYLEHKKLNTLNELMDMEDYVVAIQQMTKLLPVPKLAEAAADELINKMDGLSSLNAEFQETARYLNVRIKAFAMSASGSGELLDLINGLSVLQNAFFNKNTTQVNVQNNYGRPDGGAYSNFLSDVPAIGGDNNG